MKPMTVAELMRQLSCVDSNSVVMYDTGCYLSYIYCVDEDQGVKLSTDEVELLSHYECLADMENECLDSPYETLDFFSVSVLK